MAKKKGEKLTPVPTPRKGRQESAAVGRKGKWQEGVPPDGPDLSYIAEGLRGLAVPVGELTFDPANARKHPEQSVSSIAASLRVYKQCKPVVARRDNGVVIAGNGTLQAALSLNWSHLAVVWVDHLSGAEAAGYSISDNRTAELSEWDKDALDALLREVSTSNDERLDAMLSELAEEMKIVPPEESSQPANDPWQEWQGMPEFQHDGKKPFRSILVHFTDAESLQDFQNRIEQPFSDTAKYIYHPAQVKAEHQSEHYVDES